MEHDDLKEIYLKYIGKDHLDDLRESMLDLAVNTAILIGIGNTDPLFYCKLIDMYMIGFNTCFDMMSKK